MKAKPEEAHKCLDRPVSSWLACVWPSRSSPALVQGDVAYRLEAATSDCASWCGILK